MIIFKPSPSFLNPFICAIEFVVAIAGKSDMENNLIVIFEFGLFNLGNSFQYFVLSEEMGPGSLIGLNFYVQAVCIA